MASAVLPSRADSNTPGGHGTTVGQQFYFLTQEMREEPDEETAIRKYGLPASRIGDALRSIRALKVVLVIDTCESGAALPQLAKALSRGVTLPGIDKAVQILARSTGVHMLAAATQAQSALEIGALGHGALTYAILEALGDKEKPKAMTQDGMVTVLSLLQYVTREVEDLTKKYYGKTQTPVFNTSGTDFPLWSR